MTFCTTPFDFADGVFGGLYVHWKDEQGHINKLDLTFNRQYRDSDNNHVLVFDLDGVKGDPPPAYPGRQIEWLTVTITDEQVRLQRNKMTEPLPDGQGWCECASMSDESTARAASLEIASREACAQFNVTPVPLEDI